MVYLVDVGCKMDVMMLQICLKDLKDVLDHWRVFWQIDVEHKCSAVNTFAWQLIWCNFWIVKSSMGGSFLSQHLVHR